MTATEALRGDHEIIERVLRVMERSALRLESGRPLSPEVLSSAVDFLRNFGDQCHHAKEERQLFPRMIERGIGREAGPIGVMLHEHDLGRTYLQRLEQALDDGDDESTIEALHCYVGLLRTHLMKENEILFPLADGLLTGSDHDELVAAFQRLERERIGLGVLERYGPLVAHIERAVR